MPEATFLHIQGRDDSPTRVLELTIGPIRVGRGPLCEVRLADPELGEVQCILRRRGHTWHFQPVGPSGLVWVDGRPADQQRPLPLGVALRVGDHRLTLRAAEGSSQARGSFAQPINVEARTVVEPAPARSVEPEPAPTGPERARAATPEDSDDRLRRWQSRVEQRDQWQKDRQDEKRWEARWKAAGESIRSRSTTPSAAPPPPPRATPTPPSPPPTPRPAPAPAAGRPVEPRAASMFRRVAEPTPRPTPTRVPFRSNPEPAPPPAPVPTPPTTRALVALPAPPVDWSGAQSVTIEPTPAIDEIVGPPVSEAAIDEPIAVVEEAEAGESVMDGLISAGESLPVDPQEPLEASGSATAPSHQPSPERREGARRRGERAKPTPSRLREVLTSGLDAGTGGEQANPTPSRLRALLTLGFGDRRRGERATPTPSRLREVLTTGLDASTGTEVANLAPSPILGEGWGEGTNDTEPTTAWPAVPYPVEVEELTFDAPAEDSIPAATPEPEDWAIPAPAALSVSESLPEVEPATAPIPEPFPEPAPILHAPAPPNGEWPSVSSILAAQGVRGAAPVEASARQDRLSRELASPTVSEAPACWSIPTWLGWLPAAATALALGFGGLGLSYQWMLDESSANLAMAIATRPEGAPAPAIDPSSLPRGGWWRTTAPHLAAWSLAVARSADGEDHSEEVRSLAEAARHASPLAATTRFAIEPTARPDGEATPGLAHLGRTRDVVTLTWAGRGLRRAGKVEASLKAYRTAMAMAARARLDEVAPPTFDEDRQVLRYRLPRESTIGPVVLDMVAAGEWTHEQWVEALPEAAAGPMIASRVLRAARMVAEADRLADLAIARSDAPTPAGLDPAEHRAAVAEALASRGRWTDAAEQYRLAIERAGDDPTRRRFWLNLAEVAQRAGDDAIRSRAIESARSADSSDEISRRALRHQQGNPGLAARGDRP